MRAQSMPRSDLRQQGLMLIDPRAARCAPARLDRLATTLRTGDVLVVNDAATVPASLNALTSTGQALEIRLLGALGGSRWSAVLFGTGDWRTDTLLRPAPPRVTPGDDLRIGGGLRALVHAVSPDSPRLVELRFNRDGDALLAAMHEQGRPVQYSYLDREFELGWFQTPFACTPCAVEMPSAGRPLHGGLLLQLLRAGVELATVTHAAGLSSTGDPELDRLLPLPERYDLPARTVAAVARARAGGGRVVAVGTTVVRALEGCASRHGELRAGPGTTDLVLGSESALNVVDGVISGMHEPGESHHALLRAFAPAELLQRALSEAERAGYAAHEFGDSCLVLDGALEAESRCAPLLG